MDMDTTERVIREVMKKVKDARKRAGLTQAEVAKALNCSQQAYNGYEIGSRTIGLADLLRLPAILGVKITDLLPDSVVTDYDRARAADPRLQEILSAWNDLPEFLKDGMTSMVRDAKKEFGKGKGIK